MPKNTRSLLLLGALAVAAYLAYRWYESKKAAAAGGSPTGALGTNLNSVAPELIGGSSGPSVGPALSAPVNITLSETVTPDQVTSSSTGIGNPGSPLTPGGALTPGTPMTSANNQTMTPMSVQSTSQATTNNPNAVTANTTDQSSATNAATTTSASAGPMTTATPAKTTAAKKPAAKKKAPAKKKAAKK
jgi:hypothetical protein